MERKSTNMSIEEWAECGNKIKDLETIIHKIEMSFKKNNSFTHKIRKQFSLLRCELDNQLCSEFGGEDITSVFYGVK